MVISLGEGALPTRLTQDLVNLLISLTGIQDEVDTTQGTLGDFVDGDGSSLGFGETLPAGTTNYLNTAITLTDTVKILDTILFNRGQELDVTQGSVGSLIDDDGGFLGFGATKPAGTTNYLNSVLTITQALKELDTAIWNSESYKTYIADGTITAGSVVRIADTDDGTVSLATANSLNNCIGFVGVATETKNSGESIRIQIAGEAVINTDEIPFDQARRVYISTSNGVGSKSVPSDAGEIIYLLGICSSSANNRVILTPKLEAEIQ